MNFVRNFIIITVFACSLIFLPPVATAKSICHSIDGKADSVCTPGAINPKVTQENIHTTICVSRYTTKIRLSTTYTNKIKKQQIKEYGYADTTLADYEEDHLIPLEIGGSPTDPENLWPEPHNVTGNEGSFTKDKLEDSLHAKVCNGTITLQSAQNEIVVLWDSFPNVSNIVPSQDALSTVTPITTSRHTNTVNTSNTTINQTRAAALCSDGTYSYAVHHQGACSRHGGVEIWYH